MGMSEKSNNNNSNNPLTSRRTDGCKNLALHSYVLTRSNLLDCYNY